MKKINWDKTDKVRELWSQKKINLFMVDGFFSSIWRYTLPKFAKLHNLKEVAGCTGIEINKENCNKKNSSWHLSFNDNKRKNVAYALRFRVHGDYHGARALEICNQFYKAPLEQSKYDSISHCVDVIVVLDIYIRGIFLFCKVFFIYLKWSG